VRILLTGGNGFIGRNLREGLGPHHDLVAASRRQLDVSDDAAVDNALKSGGFDAVIHAAIPAGDQPAGEILRGFWNLARNSDRVSRILYFGSGAEYGKHRDLHKVSEQEIGDAVPRDEYGFAKLLCNELARRSRRIVNLRLFGVYGRHEKYLFKFISNTIVKVLLGSDVVVRQDVVFDYLYADDLVSIVGALLERDCPFTDMNVTPSLPIRLSEIVAILGDIADSPFSVAYEYPGLNLEYTGSNERLLHVLPELEFTPYARGVRELYGYYRNLLPQLDRDALVRDEYRLRCRPRADLAQQP
jgi:nucleoside-diphosphate-sugar epimerase